MITAIGIILLLVALGYSMVFKVPNIHYGLPSSFFGGRFKEGLDNTGNSIPIHEPYPEGFQFKAPWWKITFFSREVAVKEIKKRSFPTVDGGTVMISGVIQYRPSRTVLYRYEEVDSQGINDGLDSELNQIVGRYLSEKTIEDAVSKRQEISKCLFERLRGSNLTPDSGNLERELFRRKVMYSEQSYGIEVLKASIDLIEPEEDLKKAREDQRKEEYQKKSQTTEWNHLLEKMKLLKIEFPSLDDKLILEAVQVWQKQAHKEIREFKVTDLKEFGEAVASVLGGSPILKGRR